MSLAASKDNYRIRQKKSYWTYSMRQRKKKIHNINNSDNSQLKLPPINNPYDFGDSFMLPKDLRKKSLS